MNIVASPAARPDLPAIQAICGVLSERDKAG